MTAIVQVRDLARDYAMGDSAVHALRGVTFDVAQGEWVAIVGPSGCGKSTLLNLLGAVDRPDSGSLTIAGQRIDRLSDTEATMFRLKRIGFVFQRFYLMPALSAAENIELPLAEAKVARDVRPRAGAVAAGVCRTRCACGAPSVAAERRRAAARGHCACARERAGVAAGR